MCLFFFLKNFKAGDFISSMGRWGASPILFNINSSNFFLNKKIKKKYEKRIGRASLYSTQKATAQTSIQQNMGQRSLK